MIQLRIIDQLRAGRFILALRAHDDVALRVLLAEVDNTGGGNGFLFALGAFAADLAELAAPGHAEQGIIGMLDRLTADLDEAGGDDAA